MRGAERPAKVHWTHPFLPPLQPLSNDAARQIFVDIADDFHNNEDINQILSFTDNLPLAVDLIAHLVDMEGCANVLTRWEMEKTALLSEGYDRRSNLDTSIAISLSSPRIRSSPSAKDLLSLLSILPDGLSDVELLQASLPIRDPLGCKAALLGTALAYNDDKRRLKSLVPIREHIQHFYPPTANLVRPLRTHFYLLLQMDSHSSRGSQLAGVVRQVTSNLGNLHTILQQGLQSDHPDITETIRCTIALNRFNITTGRGRPGLMDQISTVFPQPRDHRLELEYLSETLTSLFVYDIGDPEVLISQAMFHLNYFNDPVLEGECVPCSLVYFSSEP